ncbi:hypothetical protein KBB49_00040 [Candidatus Saccharibacteria bacterium]|nr:hypothetical protein [Candidatus Saccharibacteria bacterium]
MWAFFRILDIIVKNEELSGGFSFVATSMLFVWAYLEIIAGDNYFRRILGLIVMIAIVTTNF